MDKKTIFIQAILTSIFLLLNTPLVLGETIRINGDAVAKNADFYSDAPNVSADGRYVVFKSIASNLVPNDTNGKRHIFLKGLHTGIISRINVNSNGDEAVCGDSSLPVISADGRYVAFHSTATNLVADDNNNKRDVFRADNPLAAQEMDLKQGATDIADGAAHDFGARNTGTDTDVVFTIENTGIRDLILTLPLILSGADADQFTIVDQPESPIETGATDTFTAWPTWICLARPFP